MNHKTIQPMSTLENFGYVELEKLNDLIYAYRHAGSSAPDGKYYAPLPSTWYDCGVYPEFNPSSGLVFLSNENYDALVLTEHGVMQWYSTPYSGHEGTIFDLADKVIDWLLNDDGEPLPYSEISNEWDKEDLNEVYNWLNSCIGDLEHTKADKTDLYRAKDLIVYSFILDNLPAVADKFKEDNEDWYLQLTNSINDPNYDPAMNNGNDYGYYETDLAERFVGEMLTHSECDLNISEKNNETYAEYIRNEMLKYLS